MSTFFQPNRCFSRMNHNSSQTFVLYANSFGFGFHLQPHAWQTSSIFFLPRRLWQPANASHASWAG